MNRSFLKFLTDFGPLVLFFYYYYDSGKDLKVAIPPLIIATIIALSVVWILEKKIPKVPLLSGILITFFGGLTIYFNNPIFIYIKPTIINILFGMGLIFGRYQNKNGAFFDFNMKRDSLYTEPNDTSKQKKSYSLPLIHD